MSDTYAVTFTAPGQVEFLPRAFDTHPPRARSAGAPCAR